MKAVESSDKLRIVHSDIRGAVFQRAMEMEKQGAKVLKLNTGNPATFGFEMPDSVRDALAKNLDKAVAYCDWKGMPAARESIAAYHNSRGLESVTPEDVYIGNGVSEIAQMVALSILSNGDEMLMPSPGYSLWRNAVVLAGGNPVHYECDEQAGWYPDLDDMEKKVTSKTRAVLIINPNNPTGRVYEPDLVERVIEFARKHELLIISDEIYDRLIFEDVPFRSTAAMAPDMPVITLNGLSKSHIICGFRCGWATISGPRDLTKELAECIGKLCTMRLCGNALTQVVIPAAMDDDASTKAMLVPGGRIYDQCKAATKALKELEDEGLVSFCPPQAAFYVFPKISDKVHITDDKKFARDLLEAKNILLVPGSGFDYNTPDHFRLTLLPEADILYNAIKDIGDFLKTYQQ